MSNRLQVLIPPDLDARLGKAARCAIELSLNSGGRTGSKDALTRLASLNSQRPDWQSAWRWPPTSFLPPETFLPELCDYLDFACPEPAFGDNRHDQYVFKRQIAFRHPNGLFSTGFIDLYKRACFVLEAKNSAGNSIWLWTVYRTWSR